jgi:hypothetical protein
LAKIVFSFLAFHLGICVDDRLGDAAARTGILYFGTGVYLTVNDHTPRCTPAQLPCGRHGESTPKPTSSTQPTARHNSSSSPPRPSSRLAKSLDPLASACNQTTTSMATSIRPHTASRSQIASSPTRPQTAHSTIRRVTPSPDSASEVPNLDRHSAPQYGSPNRPVRTSALGYVLDGEPARQWTAGESITCLCV